ncbi:hypothetical protein CC1G_00647 [Coprinopsis cinerea okayama7|uniref:Uncharacterized protein n=1 Tax=Coprinopsis cinerea (strain Okayama-7 / 130 / ATCC MYA-4618 / FGSC 9003) TaxID=240176 RepID=A8N3E3_COPC7|nr:hypothetical protein CC1G_00647 [Coprinopsis cinerea okayama7\|eukprot:XP_001829468.2 hypothetical protein CC1G_00647 [Coprinopsis cinerea okayama7\
MSEEPYYGPNASPKDILLERTFVAGDLLTGIGYGIQLVLFTSCATYLWGQIRSSSRNKSSKRTPVLLLSYMALLLIVETIYVAVQARTVQDIYVDNRNYPGGPWKYFLATQNKAINVIFYATLFIVTFLADLLVLWRCWVIWRAGGATAPANLAIAVPILLLIASFVMGTLWTLQSSQPGLSLYSALPKAYGQSYFFISLGFNIIITILIVSRLMMYRRTALKSLPEGHGKEYYGLVTVVVESAAVYSIFAVLFLITYTIDHPINQVCLSFASSAQQIAGYWIIYRIAKGRAWTQRTLAHNATSGGAPRIQRSSMFATGTNIDFCVATQQESMVHISHNSIAAPPNEVVVTEKKGPNALLP